MLFFAARLHPASIPFNLFTFPGRFLGAEAKYVLDSNVPAVLSSLITRGFILRTPGTLPCFFIFASEVLILFAVFRSQTHLTSARVGPGCTEDEREYVPPKRWYEVRSESF